MLMVITYNTVIYPNPGVSSLQSLSAIPCHMWVCKQGEHSDPFQLLIFLLLFPIPSFFFLRFYRTIYLLLQLVFHSQIFPNICNLLKQEVESIQFIDVYLVLRKVPSIQVFIKCIIKLFNHKYNFLNNNFFNQPTTMA